MSVYQAMESAIGATQGPEMISFETQRHILGRMVGHLRIAATVLTEGKISVAEKLKHEFKSLFHKLSRTWDEEMASSGMGMPVGPDSQVPDIWLPDARSVKEWNERVEKAVGAVLKLPKTTVVIPDRYIEFLGSVIKAGKSLCGGHCEVAQEASGQIRRAQELYRKLPARQYI